MKIEHAAVYVKDLERAKWFFEFYFGARSNDGYHNLKTDFRSYFLTWDGGARLELMNKPGLLEGAFDGESFGYAHLAFSCGSRERVDQLTGQLKDAGYTLLSGPRVTGDGYYESCIMGIEGIILEITV